MYQLCTGLAVSPRKHPRLERPRAQCPVVSFPHGQAQRLGYKNVGQLWIRQSEMAGQALGKREHEPNANDCRASRWLHHDCTAGFCCQQRVERGV